MLNDIALICTKNKLTVDIHNNDNFLRKRDSFHLSATGDPSRPFNDHITHATSRKMI